jgi:hypothetical protein
MAFVLVAAVAAATAALVTNLAHRPTRTADMPALGSNILVNGNFGSGTGLAGGWLDEVTATGRPQYTLGSNAQHLAYVGQSSDPGPDGTNAKVEVFQVAYRTVPPGTRWRFSITVSGTIRKSYLIAGIEWFDDQMRWLSESDVYPEVTAGPKRLEVTSAVLPARVSYICVYLIFPEIQSGSHVAVTVSDAILARVP